MATLDQKAFESSANLSLWFKVTAGDPLNLADVPEVIALRWNYFRDNWGFLKNRYLNQANSFFDPDYYRYSIDLFSDFVDKQRAQTTDTNPLSNNLTYYTFYPVFDTILVSDIELTYQEAVIVEKKKQKVQSFSKNDFLQIKSNLVFFRDHLADLSGLSDHTYNGIYDRGTTQSQTNATLSNLNLMLVIQKQITAVNFILSNLFAIDAVVDPFSLAKLNANNPDVDIGQHKSGFLVKLHYKEDLQGLATRYFGDPNKWIDIAIANGLKEPYIDETGEQLSLLANGNGNQINITAKDPAGNSNIAKLSINQFVELQSDTLPFASQRIITALKEIPVSGEIVITLNGEANLGQYLLVDNASIRVFKSNTANSSQFILIPSPQPLPTQRVDEVPWFQSSSAADEKRTKIDLAIDDNGSLMLTSNGDVALNYGLSNAIQAIKLKLQTEVGTNRYHPEFGLVNVVGTKNLDITGIKTLLVNSITAQIQSDGRFDRVESLSIERDSQNPTCLLINLSVRLAGGSTVIPISFSLAL
jgi:hypothetical protein